MKIWLVTVMAALLLCGCGAQDTMETVSDELLQSVMVEKRQLLVTLPPEAAAAAMEGDAGEIYICTDYDIFRDTWEAGDLNSTIRKLSGYEREDLTVMQTQEGDVQRYEFVWVSAGEAGDRLGRAVILDDGNFHYCLSILADAEKADQYRSVWQSMFDSVALN